MKSHIRAFDATVSRWIKSWPRSLRATMYAITNTGQPLTVILFTSALLVWSYTRSDQDMVTASIVVLATVIVSSALKLLLRRSRPETDYVARMWFKSFSFPSGHAAAATVGFGFLAYLMAHTVIAPLGVVLAVLFAGYALLVGISRVYLGAHHPSDVVGGILLGLAGLAVIMTLVKPLA